MIAPAFNTQAFRSGEVVPLDMLRADEQAAIVEMVGDPRQIHRLEEMGLREGSSVRMVRPGSPCLLAIDSRRVSLRLDEATDILVKISEKSVRVAV